MVRITVTLQAVFVTRAFLDLVVILNVRYTEIVPTTRAFVTNSRDIKATCVTFQAVPAGLTTAVTMVRATKPT